MPVVKRFPVFAALSLVVICKTLGLYDRAISNPHRWTRGQI